jgi:hypothetical protein
MGIRLSCGVLSVDVIHACVFSLCVCVVMHGYQDRRCMDGWMEEWMDGMHVHVLDASSVAGMSMTCL